MKTFWQTIWVALSMYSRLPVPRAEWNSKNMRYALCALPLVGVFSGALLWLWDWLCRALEPGEMLLGAGVVLLPILVTGGQQSWAEYYDAGSRWTARKGLYWAAAEGGPIETGEPKMCIRDRSRTACSTPTTRSASAASLFWLRISPSTTTA